MLIFRIMKRQVLTNLILFILLCFFTAILRAPFFLSSLGAHSSLTVDQTVQNQEKETDYMTTLLERNPNPLGLKENPELQRYLSQPPISWAIRAEKGHILH